MFNACEHRGYDAAQQVGVKDIAVFIRLGVLSFFDVLEFAVMRYCEFYLREKLKRAFHLMMFSASESFSKKNINCTIQQSFERITPLIQRARQDGVRVRG